jgi:hypothetical protein
MICSELGNLFPTPVLEHGFNLLGTIGVCFSWFECSSCRLVESNTLVRLPSSALKSLTMASGSGLFFVVRYKRPASYCGQQRTSEHTYGSRNEISESYSQRENQRHSRADDYTATAPHLHHWNYAAPFPLALDGVPSFVCGRDDFTKWP